MNELMKKLLLSGAKFMPEMHLKQPIFTYSACVLFTKQETCIQKFIERHSRFISEIELDKACF